jgi:hypothetical protein
VLLGDTGRGAGGRRSGRAGGTPYHRWAPGRTRTPRRRCCDGRRWAAGRRGPDRCAPADAVMGALPAAQQELPRVFRRLVTPPAKIAHTVSDLADFAGRAGTARAVLERSLARACASHPSRRRWTATPGALRIFRRARRAIADWRTATAPGTRAGRQQPPSAAVRRPQASPPLRPAAGDGGAARLRPRQRAGPATPRAGPARV